MTKKKRGDTSHVVAGTNSFRCMHCGEEYVMTMPCSVDVYVAASRAFLGEHKSCRLEPGVQARRFSFKTPEEWIASWDTGASSMTIWSVMTGRPCPDGRPGEPPADPSDFGRCYRLLKAFPAWRARLGEVVARYPAWSELVANWAELTALFEEELDRMDGKAPKLYARLQELRGKG